MFKDSSPEHTRGWRLKRNMGKWQAEGTKSVLWKGLAFVGGSVGLYLPVEQGSGLRSWADWDPEAKHWNSGVFNISYGRDSPFMAIYVFAYIFCSQAFTLIRQDQAGLMTRVSKSTVVFFPAELCMQPHIPACAQLHGEHAHLSGVDTQLCSFLAGCADRNLWEPCCYSTAGLGSF